MAFLLFLTEKQKGTKYDQNIYEPKTPTTVKGWIKLHRKIQNHWIWTDDKYFRYWIIILLNVNYEPSDFNVSDKKYICDCGQSFKSIDTWTSLFGCSKKTTIKFFKMLKNEGMIDTQILGNGNRRKHLLSVEKWEEYQQTETENYTERKLKITPKGNPNVTPNKNIKNNKNKEDIFNFRKSIIDLGVQENIADDWLKVRKEKRAANTETAFNLTKKEIEKSGRPANDCIEYAVFKSWQGFKASWLENENKTNGKVEQTNGKGFKSDTTRRTIESIQQRIDALGKIDDRSVQ